MKTIIRENVGNGDSSEDDDVVKVNEIDDGENEDSNDGSQNSGGMEDNEGGKGDEFKDSQDKESDQGDQDSLTSSSSRLKQWEEEGEEGEEGEEWKERCMQQREAKWRARVHDSNELVELLLANGAKADAKNRDGKTPLSIAREEGFDNIVAILEEHLARQG